MDGGGPARSASGRRSARRGAGVRVSSRGTTRHHGNAEPGPGKPRVEPLWPDTMMDLSSSRSEGSSMNRRNTLKAGVAMGLVGAAHRSLGAGDDEVRVMTVRGPIPPEELGPTLPH